MTTLPRVARAILLGLTLYLSLTLCSTAVLAAEHGPKGATTQASNVRHYQPNDDAGIAPVKIYGNLGPADNLYDAANGWWVAGPDNAYNSSSQHIAVPFTPVQDATVTRVKIALQYYGFGVNSALVAIYDDASGLPGKVLAKRRRGNFDDYGSGCCNLALWTLTTPLPLKAGTQYWVVGTTNKKTRDSMDIWDWVFNDKPGTFAFEIDKSGWILLNASFGYPLSAVAVRGTVP